MTLQTDFLRANLVKAVCSNAVKQCEYRKITVRPVESGGRRLFQAEKLTETKAFHENFATAEAEGWLQKNVIGLYRQIVLFCTDCTVTYLFSKNGKCKRLVNKTANAQQQLSFDRQKNYIFKEGENIPAFVDLGIFTKDFKVVQSKYDKYKQTNRFIEIVDDVFADSSLSELTVLDFGCGKSYLTFFLYHYFANVKKIKVKIIGYDLKSDVVENCNQIAQKYGYENLHFVVADVSKDVLYQEKIDMVISLHACDTATDYALYYAIQKNAKYIFSVPCCQHEVNATIKKGGEFDILLKYGLAKERFSALLTDCIRASLLEDCGYRVDMLEFVDFAHSPKNVMLRCEKTNRGAGSNAKSVENLMDKYGFSQTLYKLLKGSWNTNNK